ncbi:MAG: hypothetical protein K7J15_05980 [Candidatus Regiella insecticola]|nr:hypothetical protein [Candidatus Regiella insecticola]
MVEVCNSYYIHNIYIYIYIYLYIYNICYILTLLVSGVEHGGS